jgi:hypothetical protein
VLTDRASQLARQAKVTHACQLRMDSICVQTTIHHPTESGVLRDGVYVLTRLILLALRDRCRRHRLHLAHSGEGDQAR